MLDKLRFNTHRMFQLISNHLFLIFFLSSCKISCNFCDSSYVLDEAEKKIKNKSRENSNLVMFSSLFDSKNCLLCVVSFHLFGCFNFIFFFIFC